MEHENCRSSSSLYLAAAAAEIYEDDLNNEAISMIRNLAVYGTEDDVVDGKLHLLLPFLILFSSNH